MRGYYKSMTRVLFLCFSMMFFFSWVSLKPQEKFKGQVTYIYDGDTYEVVLFNSEKERIRLYGIDCPETKQRFGAEATQFVTELLEGNEVVITKHYTDHYGRIIADVEVSGKDLASELLANGYAWHYKQYSQDEDLSNLEKEARVKQVGLWVDPEPVAPWEYRRKR